MLPCGGPLGIGDIEDVDSDPASCALGTATRYPLIVEASTTSRSKWWRKTVPSGVRVSVNKQRVFEVEKRSDGIYVFAGGSETFDSDAYAHQKMCRTGQGKAGRDGSRTARRSGHVFNNNKRDEWVRVVLEAREKEAKDAVRLVFAAHKGIVLPKSLYHVDVRLSNVTRAYTPVVGSSKSICLAVRVYPEARCRQN